jgi:cyclophilin family peptidyl-prolyl cis-trans isomerase
MKHRIDSAWLARAAWFIALLLALALACGGDDEDNTPPAATAMPQATMSASADLTCGPSGSSIAAIERNGRRMFEAPPERVIDEERDYTARLETEKGLIVLELAAGEAPNTVNNFVFLACTGYYDGLTFHRVVKTPVPFVIQGGDPRGDGTGGPGYLFDNEISPNLSHNAAGVLSMARAEAPDTNGSQFFITLGPAPHLDGLYNAFGHVTEGQDVVDSIERGDRIISITVEESS